MKLERLASKSDLGHIMILLLEELVQKCSHTSRKPKLFGYHSMDLAIPNVPNRLKLHCFHSIKRLMDDFLISLHYQSSLI